MSRNSAEKLGLEPMRLLDLDRVENTAGLLEEMSRTAFTGRALGEALTVAERMFRDEDCWVVLTLSGAMTMAGLRQLITLMIERKWVQCVVATGALVGHGMVEELGMTHYKARRDISDETYQEHGLNRVYDTIEPEENLDQMELLLRERLSALADEREEPLGTAELLDYLGRNLPGHGVLQLAAEHGVPLIIPAFSDSELGLDFAVHRLIRREANKRPLAYDGMRDLEQFARRCEDVFTSGRRLGIFTIGGGVPRNWAQQVGPYLDIRNKRMGQKPVDLRYTYGVRICPDPVHYGHLSGCTYSEGVSWGKFLSVKDGGQYAEVLLDATVAWPLLVQALRERGL
ncbi:MAG: deoxyhypusine synthase family protein [Deltaproteobacteria bacterium]|nr:deoxyhypusine synthase family protein [Deltaproteobacteria bacterium]